MTPYIVDKRGPKDVDESTDTYEPDSVTYMLHDVFHTFKKGHRLMVVLPVLP